MHKIVHLRLITFLFVMLSVLLYYNPLLSENNKKDNNLNKKLLNQVFHPLLSLPSKQQTDPKLLEIRNKISKISLKETPIISTSEKTNSKCFSNYLNELNEIEKNSQRGIKDSIHFMKGILFELCSDNKLALEEYEKSLQLRRGKPNVHFRFAVSSLKNSPQSDIKPILDEALWRKFPHEHLIYFISALSLNILNKTDEALTMLEKSLLKKPTFYESSIEAYKILKKKRAKVTTPSELSLIDNKINLHLVNINKSDYADRNTAIEHIRILLLSGDSLTSPNKLNEGIALSEKWIKKSDYKDDEILLYKIQFLEKMGKSNEALELIQDRETKGELSPALQAKKTFYEEK